ITLSGSTINQELKYIYKSSLGSEELTGQQEIFKLRDLLKTYGEQRNLKKKEVYLYSLNGGGNIKDNPKWWKIYVGQLDISRSKDKPFCYNYKFTATGVPEIKESTKVFALDNITEKKVTSINNVTDEVKTVTKKKNYYRDALNFVDSWYNTVEESIAKMENTADKIQSIGGGIIKDISDAISKVRISINDFNSACRKYTNMVNGFIEGVVDIAHDTVQLGDKVLYSALRFMPAIVAEVWNTCLEAKDSFVELGEICASVDDWFSESSWNTIKEMFDDSVSKQDISDAFSKTSCEGEQAAEEVVAATSKILNFIGFVVIPGDDEEDDIIVNSFGFKVVTITDAETSWDQIAENYYGDASLASLIATANNTNVEGKLEAGQKLIIPNLNFAESKGNDNEVYTPPDEKDNYGTDIKIEDGDFELYNKDIETVDGVKNLEQALMNRYSTLIGARIRLLMYGIQAAIGDALKASSALIQASVHQTTIEDPRVDSVEQIQFDGKGDQLAVMIIYVDKNGKLQNYGGVIQ
ncbi:MAG: hypothetical protein J6T31_00360, partial [Methanobrevibacter sp.]|nr:hypothetical protein [Methanobrevibacter sp.]